MVVIAVTIPPAYLEPSHGSPKEKFARRVDYLRLHQSIVGLIGVRTVVMVVIARHFHSVRMGPCAGPQYTSWLELCLSPWFAGSRSLLDGKTFTTTCHGVVKPNLAANDAVLSICTITIDHRTTTASLLIRIPSTFSGLEAILIRACNFTITVILAKIFPVNSSIWLDLFRAGSLAHFPIVLL